MVRRITKKSIQKQKGIEICSFGATIKQTGHFLHYGVCQEKCVSNLNITKK